MTTKSQGSSSDSGCCHSGIGRQLKAHSCRAPLAEVDRFVSEEGAELLAIFVSLRIGEAMSLESVRYISLSYIP